jgi:steroid delta-isomerase-like uncharacterized protein
MSAEQNIETIRKSVQAQNAREFDVFTSMVTPNFVRHELAHMFGGQRGQKELDDLLQTLFKVMPDFQNKIVDVFATENRGAAHFSITGTHKGEILGVAPTGKKVTFDAITLYRFEDDKIAEVWPLIDVAGFLRQIGAIDK